MTHQLPFTIVDVFAEEKYAGNQLAVFQGNPDDDTMRKLALEMNYSETTFITSNTPENGGYTVRIFTPASELPFAGHPTLGTAAVIRQEIIREPVTDLILNLEVGQIPVHFRDDGTIWMIQKPPRFGQVYAVSDMASVLNLSESDFDTRFPVQAVSTGLPFIITPLKTLDAVKRARVNVDKLTHLINTTEDDLKADAILVVAPETYHEANDLNVRVFVHLHGIPEDPATGSANGNLAGYLAKYRYFGSASPRARVEQGYEIRRPSLLFLEADDDGENIEVRLGGRVQRIAQGQLV